MKLKNRPLAEISQDAIDLLTRELGVVDTIRFMNQFSMGSGDYTKDRESWLDGLTREEILKGIKKLDSNR